MFLYRRNQKGAILVMSAFVFMTAFVLCALIIDGGFLYRLKSLARHVSEQSAIGGASVLAENFNNINREIINKAEKKALYIAKLNGFSEGVKFIPDIEKGLVTVIVKKKMKFIFARIIKKFEIDVAVSAKASYIPGFRGGKDLLPVSVRNINLKKGESTKFSFYGSPQLLPLVVSGNGTGFFRANLEEGVKKTMRLGDNIKLLKDNPLNIMYSALLSRIAGHETEVFNFEKNYIEDNLNNSNLIVSTPRVVMLPVVEQTEKGLVISDFASIFIENLFQSAQDSGFNGVFLGSAIKDPKGNLDYNKIVRLVK